MGAGTMKSRNYNSTLPGSLDDFYVIGCKWTPYEVTIYLNGKAISSKSDHSPYDTVTFDAFRHGACNVPLHVIVSGQIMTKSWRCHDFTGFKIPETYEVDYVRVYGCPDAAEGMRPQVSATTSFGGRMAMPSGGTLTLKADVRPAARTGSPIRAVHLFDDGYHLATCRQPPYEFKVPFTYGTPDEGNHGVLIACDDDIVGRLKLHPHEYPDWRATTKGEVTVKLPAGRHVLTLLLFGQFNFSDLEFLRIR